MSRAFDEGRLRFEFGDDWQVEKYDDHPAYRLGIQRLQGSQAVDFVGLCGELFLIEVKDVRGSRIENKPRIEYGDLSQEIAHKVRDTVAGLVGAHRSRGGSDVWKPYVQALAKDRVPLIRVVLWLEMDKLAEQRRKKSLSTLTQKLKADLRWLTTKVVIVDRASSMLPDLHVTGRPSSGVGSSGEPGEGSAT